MLDNSGFTSGLNALGKTGATGLKVFTAGVATATTGLSALGTSAVNTFADYEQLVGGVETLFGTGGKLLGEYAISIGKTVNEAKSEYDRLMSAQSEVLNNASKAYETAGLSANEYMETVTSIAAALKQSTASELEAAEAADQAIIDMSDNANKMGTSMESIQNAYQGFAKQNYTMLDNLKLGYGGTKEEMKRLLEDATAISGIEYDLDSLSDVYAAIHVIQEELGITGTTAKEASTTISGSVKAMKASWQNLLVGIADDSQDFDKLVDNFVESTITAADNILPRIEVAVEGIGHLIDSIAPILIEKIPLIVLEVVPDLLEAGIQMVSALIEGIYENAPQIADAAHEIVDTLLDELGELIPAINPLTDAIQLLIDHFDTVLAVIVPLTAAFVAWKTAVSIASIVNALSKAMDGMTIAQYAAKLAQDLLNASMLANPFVLIVTLIAALVAGFLYLWNTSEGFRNFWIELWESIKTTAAAVVEAIVTFFTVTIPETFNNFIGSAKNLISQFVNSLEKNAPQLLTAALAIITALSGGLVTYLPKLLAGVPGLMTQVKNKFSEIASGFADIGQNIINGIWSGLSAGWDWLVGKVKELAASLFGAAKEELDVNSPSKKFEWLADMCIAGWDNRMDDFMDPNNMTRNIRASLGVMKNNINGGKYFSDSSGPGNIYQTVYVNREVATADELARAMRIEARYGMMRGVPVG